MHTGVRGGTPRTLNGNSWFHCNGVGTSSVQQFEGVGGVGTSSVENISV